MFNDATSKLVVWTKTEQHIVAPNDYSGAPSSTIQ